MSRMTKVPTTQTPSITKPLLGHNTKSKLDFIPHLIDLFDECVCESAKENLLQLEKLESPTSFSHILQIFLNSQNPPRLLLPINPGENFLRGLTTSSLKITRK